MAVCGIYKITEKETNKCYIGQSKDIYERLKQHSTDTYSEDDWHTKFQSNPEKFTFEILVRCDPEDLDNEESYYIYKYNSIQQGYNKKNGNHSIFKTAINKLFKLNSNSDNNSNNNEKKMKIEKNSYLYSVEDLINQINLSKATFYEQKKKNISFFNDNSKKIKEGCISKPKIKYNKKIFDMLLQQYGEKNR